MIEGKITCAVGGGKGGVGKSVIAANMACCLAREGSRVVLIDADLAGANIHTLFGIRRPEVVLSDFIARKVPRIADVLIPAGLPNLSLICGAADLLETANPKYAQKQKLLRAMAELEADYVVIDIGAGSTLNNLDFFNAAAIGLIVTTPAPTALQNAYAFLKLALQRRILSLFGDEPGLREEIMREIERGGGARNMVSLVDHMKQFDEAASWKLVKLLLHSRYRLIVNMASEMDGQRIANVLGGLAYQFLRLKLPSLGTIGVSSEIEQSVRRMQPLALSDNTAAAHAVRKIVRKMKEEAAENSIANPDRPAAAPPPARETAAAAAPAAPPQPEDGSPYRAREGGSTVQLCLNDEFVHEGVRLHIQTEDLGIKKAKVLTLVFRGGHILFSKGTDYSEFVAPEQLEQSVADRVRWQHKAILAGILAGKLGDRLHGVRGT